MEEESYCRYEREHRQKHLEESKVNMASRQSRATYERKEERGESQRQESRNQEQGPRGQESSTAKMAGLYRNQKLGGGGWKQSPWAGEVQGRGEVRRAERSYG